MTHWINLAADFNYIFLMISFLLRDMFYLRCTAILSSTASITYSYFATAHPLWIIIRWETVLITINIVQMAILLYEKRSFNLPEEELALFKTFFHGFTPKQFKKLLKMAKHGVVETEEIVTEQGKMPNRIMFIKSGMMSLEVDGKLIAVSSAGSFVDELSFLSDIPATATVRAIEPCEYLAWPLKSLRQTVKNDIELHVALQTHFNKNLLQKLLQPTKNTNPCPKCDEPTSVSASQ